MAEVRLINVKKVYEGNVTAVHSFSLDIQDKEFVVLVGPSGCGKSTTLRMIAGLEEISEGEVYIGERLVNDVPPKDRDIAMVFQNYALYPHMSVYKNMAFGLKLRKYPKKEIDQRVNDAARILGLETYLDRKPKQLSGGQRQRVAVGRAIVRKPKVFLFDEPLSNLDAKMRVQMRTEISKLHARLQTTMIYVTHDQVEAMTMGDRIVVMKDGFIQQVADPITLYNQPANKFVAGFIGTPPMNFMHGRVVAERDTLWFDGQSLRVRMTPDQARAMAEWSGRETVLGVRPEDILEAAPGANGHDPVNGGIEVVEPMGAETYLYVSCGTHNFIAKVAGHARHRDGEAVTLHFDMSKAHFFDVTSEKTIV